MSGIKLSPKYGLNPSMTVCFFCGQPKGIALMGRINPSKSRGRNAEDVEAPGEIVTDYEPCDKCAEAFKNGVLVVEVDDAPIVTGQPTIDGTHYPTGKAVCVKTEAMNRAFAEPGKEFKDGNRVLFARHTYELCFGEATSDTKEV